MDFDAARKKAEAGLRELQEKNEVGKLKLAKLVAYIREHLAEGYELKEAGGATYKVIRIVASVNEESVYFGYNPSLDTPGSAGAYFIAPTYVQKYEAMAENLLGYLQLRKALR